MTGQDTPRVKITTNMVRIAAWENYRDQYVAGTRVALIARQSGIPAPTITDWLKRDGVFVLGRKPGPIKQTVCQREHDMTIPRNRLAAGGCAECKRERERVAYKRKM